MPMFEFCGKKPFTGVNLSRRLDWQRSSPGCDSADFMVKVPAHRTAHKSAWSDVNKSTAGNMSGGAAVELGVRKTKLNKQKTIGHRETALRAIVEAIASTA